MAAQYELPISRRRFVQDASVAGLGLLAGCGRLPGQAAAPASVPRIGYLSATSPERALRAAFVQGLAALGYVEGQNVAIEVRYAEAQADRLSLATELVHLPVDILVVSGARAIQAAKSATSTVPIVMAFTSSDPVADGFVASLARPGGNVTGLSAMSPQLSGKRLELVRETVAGAPVAVLWNAANSVPQGRLEELQTAAQLLSVPLQSLEVREAGDLEAAFEAAFRERAVALITLHDALTNTHQDQIVALAAKHRLPAMYENSEWTDAGGLMAYGASRPSMHRRAAYYVDRILKGTKPADLPIEQPREFEFVINLKTAQALGLTIPQHVLLQATEILQ